MVPPRSMTVQPSGLLHPRNVISVLAPLTSLTSLTSLLSFPSLTSPRLSQLPVLT